MSLRLNASLCLPQGILKSTNGVCWLVFLPSIQTSDQGTELTVIVQSPPFAPLSSSALAPAPSAASSALTSRPRLCRGVCGAGGGGATTASCGSGFGLGGASACAGGGAGGTIAGSGCDAAFPDPGGGEPDAGTNVA